MANMTKGAATRQRIIEKARKIYNDHGIDITIGTLAQKMGVSRSRISNHFPTKDSLFVSILQEYEREYSEILPVKFSPHNDASLQQYVNTLWKIMDVQQKYRCALIYLNVLSPSQHEIKKQIRKSYDKNLLLIRERMQYLVDQNLIESKVLAEPWWSSFLFVYINLLTQWVVHLDMYDSDKSYEENKTNYLRGILTHLYLPYLTQKGKQAFDRLNFHPE